MDGMHPARNQPGLGEFSMKHRSTFVALLVMLCILAGANSTWGAAGDLLWQKNFDFLPNYDRIIPAGAGFSDHSCIVWGRACHSDSTIGDLAFIKAFDIKTGNLQWQRTLTLGENENYYDIKITGKTVYINSNSASYTTKGNHHTRTYTLRRFILGAYNARTGQTLWEKTIDNFGGWMESSFGFIPVKNDLIITVGTEQWNQGGPTGNCIVSVYQGVGQGVIGPVLHDLLLEK